MSNDTVVSLAAPALVPDPLTELLRSGARRLVEAAVRAEFEEHLSAFGHEKLPDGRQRVVRNGRLPECKILTGLGEVDVRVPKARSRSGSPEPFRSSVAPPCVRRCASLDAAIPWLYLHGVSTGQMRQAVGALVGERAARGLSANVVSRLKRSWDQEYQQWRRRRLDDEWVYLWADGLYSGLRGEGERLCVLVIIGVNTRGEKHFLAIEDGVRESTQSWREVLLAMKQRGFTRPAKLAVGDGALGFWAALSEVFPSTRPQRCWVHKTGNVLNYLPKSGQAKAKQGLHEIWGAQTRAKAERAFDQWLERYDDKYPKATACLARDRDELLAFYDFPAAHWTHLRTTNVIESAFATIRHRSSRAKGCVTRQTMLSMTYKMGRCAEKSWRRLRGFRHLAKVIKGVRFNLMAVAVLPTGRRGHEDAQATIRGIGQRIRNRTITEEDEGVIPYPLPCRAVEGEHVHEQADYRSPERELHGSRTAGTDGDGRRDRGWPCRPPRPRAPGWRHGRRPRELRLGRGLPGSAAPLRTRYPARALGVRNRPGGPAVVLGRKGGTPPTQRAA